MTIAQGICFVLAGEFVSLLAIDLWLGFTGREVITHAIRAATQPTTAPAPILYQSTDGGKTITRTN